MSDIDLTETIEDAVQDATMDTAPVTPDADPAPVGSTEGDPAPSLDPSIDPSAAPQDEFEKRWGIPSRSITGRENRIPHSRVKQMIAKAEQEALARAAEEQKSQFTPKLSDYETKIKTYEERLGKVAEFEQVLQNDPQRFLQFLSTIPAYKPLFDFISKASETQAPAAPAAPTLDHSDMPQPDVPMPDGSKVYSLEGLAARDEWLAKKIEERALRSAEEKITQRYLPMEQRWQQEEQMARLVPVIEKQIAEARTWPNFAELEPAITAALQADRNLTLDRAYLKAYQEQVVPKMTADRNKVRSEVLAELKQKPTSAAAPVSAVRPAPQRPAEGMSREEIIAEALREAGIMG